MAIQNFLSGGFYGKLGDVVGQRWHNKRVIRSYVIPFNPRTEKQQANRQLFALATALAQQAYNINKGSPLWDTAKMGQFSQMVSLAKRRLQAGMSPSEALPLYPEAHVSNVTLSNPTAHWDAWPAEVMIRDDSYAFTDARTIEIIIQAFDERQDQWVFVNDAVSISQGSPFAYAFNTDNRYSLPPGSSIQALTADDASFRGSSVQLPPFSIAQPSKALIHTNVTFDQLAYAMNGNFIILSFPLDFPGKYVDFEVDYRVWHWGDNVWETINTLIEIDNGGIGTIHIDTSEYEARSGACIYAGSGSYIGYETADFTFSWGQFNFQYP
jgi:hypothetical protein